MPYREFAGCLLKGKEADIPAHAPSFEDFHYYATDTGNEFWNDGTQWVHFSGPTKTEALTNKHIDLTNNTVLNAVMDPFVTRKREGFLYPALTPDGSLKGALKGLPHAGNYSYQYASNVDGYCSRFETNVSGDMIGYYYTDMINMSPFTKREDNPMLKIRARPSTTTNSRLLIGFADNILAFADTPLGISGSGVLVGFNIAEANFVVIRNDGTGTELITPFTTLAKDTVYRTFEVAMTGNNVTISVDNESLTYETFIPGLNVPLYPYIQYQSNDTVTKTLDITKGYFRGDI